MADHPGRGRAPRPRSVKPVGILFALVFLAVASVVLVGNPWWMLTSAALWVSAAAVALVGLVLLWGALPGRRRSR